MNAGEVYAALAATYCAPEWALIPDVASGTGSTARRRADAVALNLWPSRGLEVRGFEIKVSRSDLGRELKQPEKAEAISRYCHTWWIAAPAGMVKPEELPLGWGLVEANGNGCRTKRAAVPREDVAQPTRHFTAALIRAAHAEVEDMRKEWVPRAEIFDRIQQARRDGEQHAPHAAMARVKDLEERLAGAAPILAALGIDVNATKWDERLTKADGETYARAIAVGKAILGRYSGRLETVILQLKNAEANMTKMRAGLEELIGGTL